MKKESEVLVSVAESTRGLVKFYLSKLKEVDMYKTFTVEGMTLNSPAWLVCHLVWAENFLLLKGTGAKEVSYRWINDFGLGSAPKKIIKYPSIKESLDAFKEVHQIAMEHLKSLDDDQLDKLNKVGLKFGDQATIRSIIEHHIRHEASHAGHLGWITKMHGIKTI